MSNTKVRRPKRLYGLIVRLYPESYRQEFGEEMKYVFSESLRASFAENGERGIISLWSRTLADASKSLVVQHLENNKGVNIMKPRSSDIIMQNAIFSWIALATGAILLIPLIAMQFTNEVNWDVFDFMVMGTLLFGVGSLFVLAARKIRKTSHRIAIGIVFGLALLYIWAELSVGIFTSLGS